MNNETILIVEDESRIRRLISDYLKLENFKVLESKDGIEALEVFANEEIDLIILDIMLPKYDGWAVCREIRKKSRVPIIILTARSEETDQLFGFELGADEYVTKPFSPKVLMARVKNLLKRASNSEIKPVKYGNLLIDNISHRVYTKDKEVDLTPKEYELLEYMVKNIGKALSRYMILNNVWGYDYYGDIRTVDTHIKRLRVKVDNEGNLIHTVRGFGYRFEVKQ